VAQIVAVESAQPSTSELLDDAEDLLENHDAWESLKTDTEKAQTDEQTNKRHGLQHHADVNHSSPTQEIGKIAGESGNDESESLKESGALEGELVGLPGDEGDEMIGQLVLGLHRQDTEQLADTPVILGTVSDASSIVQAERDVNMNVASHKDDKIDDVVPETSKLTELISSELEPDQVKRSSTVEDQAEGLDGLAKSKDMPKVKQTHKVKESSKIHESTKARDRESAKVKETPKVKVEAPKQYSKGLDVSQMKTPDKKPVEKKEPLLKV
jgi:hypothetical protein